MAASPRAQSKHRKPSFRKQAAIGRRDGLNNGFQHGFWYGQCESVLQRIPQQTAVWPIHAMFVATSKGFPYSPIDAALAETLAGMTRQLTVTNDSQPVAAIAAQARPDIVIVLDGLNMPLDQIDAIRALGIRTAIWFTDDPYYTDMTSRIALHFDDVFTLELSCVEFYRNLGCPNVHYLPLGFHPAEFRPRNPPAEKRHEVSFVGSAYWKRAEFFDQIADYLASKDSFISGIWWERLTNYNKLKDKIALGAWMGPLETSAVYNGAKIAINMHRAHDDQTFNNNSAGIPAVSPNPRTFEIAACATLQLTDERSDLVSFFTPGLEIVTYASPQEMIEKIDYYLAHEHERREIAIRGMRRAMSDHTYARRLDLMFQMLFAPVVQP
ncbi:CgeB family protein [Paenibacillus methanolicus]|uniref:Spore maturation protein CgeB n=1 Tax=Paenibacillus methanolicus TaxID=582686 RepID=A0A5S5BRN4_9BACL|nr:glycosyltransferase [Paenibacillus methanolicus]TYP69851.1 spore maturation protein CgeB [Paenibacillus methanolicus]